MTVSLGGPTAWRARVDLACPLSLDFGRYLFLRLSRSVGRHSKRKISRYTIQLRPFDSKQSGLCLAVPGTKRCTISRQHRSRGFLAGLNLFGISLGLHHSKAQPLLRNAYAGGSSTCNNSMETAERVCEHGKPCTDYSPNIMKAQYQSSRRITRPH